METRETCWNTRFGQGKMTAIPMTRRLKYPDEEARRLAVKDRERSRRARKHSIRAATFTHVETKRMCKEDRALYPEDGHKIPKTRGDCKYGVRPCPYVSCKYNLFLDVSPRSGTLKLNFPDLEPDEMSESCVLDIADRGGLHYEDVGVVMNVTRERVRQVLNVALTNVSKLKPEDEWDGVDSDNHPTPQWKNRYDD